MFNKKILSGVLCGVMLLSSTSVFAQKFSDVENDPGVEWAKPYINAMAEEGYLKGYEDGTFKPQSSISKTEALILLARMIGVNDDSFADSVEYAVDEYADILDKYSTKYPEEVSFLLYTGVLKESDLGDYISNTNKNEPLKRYEASILLTKLLGAEEQVLSNAFVSSTYADATEIPDSARAYVEYVREEGIMQGMGNNKNGQPEFWPNTPVTRAQMAKMLYSLIDVLDISVQTGVVASVDTFEETVTVTIDGNDLVYTIEPSTRIKINGQEVAAEDLTRGMHVKVTHVAGKLSLIENNVVVDDAVIYGLVSGTKNSGDSKSITIADANDKSKIETYVLADGAKVRVNGAVENFSKVKNNNYVALTLEDGEVTLVEVIDKSTSTGGTLISVEADGEGTVLLIENKSGDVEEFEISKDGVVVSRNNLDSSLGQLMEGDTLALKLTYGKVTKISASSKKQEISGSIEAITHTTSGTSMKIKSSSKTYDFKVNKSAKVVINSTEEGTVYDLRPGTDVIVEIESSEIIAVEAASKVVKSQLSGVVVSINPEYSLMVVEDEGKEYSVYVNTNTKIVDSLTGKLPVFKTIEKGRAVNVTGSNASGVFEASVIVLQ